MATLVNKKNREVKIIIPNMREFSTFYSDNEGVIGMFFKRDWAEETTKKELPMPEDSDLFLTGVKEGRRLEREDMKNELAKRHLEGYIKGREDAEKQYNESVAYHFPIMPTPPSGWGCDGTHCTNPHYDCINCPGRHSSGGTITTPNTASGTSTATLHSNTSATDGKEHNPSFTD